MICPFCSLLCDEDSFQSVPCGIRANALNAIERFQKTKLASSEKAPQEQIKSATKLLQAAEHILITGRIASVQTARSAIRLAKRLNATMDCAEGGHAFKNILPIQRNGVHSVSLGEARDHADLLIVVGDDSVLSGYPRLPQMLRSSDPSNRVKKTVLLLGDFSESSQQRWQQAGMDTWFIPCKLESIPAALTQWSKVETPSGSDLMGRLAQSRYTAVLWVASSLRMPNADLWIERLMQWIAGQNETTRCAGLVLSSLEGSFQQACTWLTGFPGRIRFQEGEPIYDPSLYIYSKWIESAGARTGNSAIVLIDETVSEHPFLENQVEAGLAIPCIEISATSSMFPCAIAGAEVTADMFRADQAIVARVDSQPACIPGHSAADWLEKLCR
jgi:formylmethanofuran dehydrogenase subunit B